MEQVVDTGAPQQTAKAERDQHLAKLHDSPGWEFLRKVLLANTKFEQADVADPNWQGHVMRRQFRSELSLELVRMVDAAHARVAEQSKKHETVGVPV